MLTELEINSFLRINELQVDLSKASVHVFCGPNEAGKSSIGQAIRFALAGLSERVKLKGSFSKLISNGKRNGSVALTLDGFTVRRNIRDGKLTTTAPLDFDELLVDIQLGAEEFARCDAKEIRRMLNKVFKNEAPIEFVRTRLKKLNVLDKTIDRVLPMLKTGGFESACEEAKSEVSKLRGAWEQITSETYGSVKAVDWKPEVLSKPTPETQELATHRKRIETLSAQRDNLNVRLGRASENMRLSSLADSGDHEALKKSVAETTERFNLAKATLDQAQSDYTVATDRIRDEVSALQDALRNAQQLAAQLECPACGVGLHLTTEGDTPVLTASEKRKSAKISVPAAAKALEEGRTKLATARTQHQARIEDARSAFTSAQTAAIAAEKALSDYETAVSQRSEEQDDPEEIAMEIAQIDDDIAAAQALVSRTEEDTLAISNAQRAMQSAKAKHAEIVAWSVVVDALGNGPDGIPAELSAKTTKPLNAALAKLAPTFETSPIVMAPDMTLSRDGMPYYLLSESARWRANAMVQLALASLSTLKVVVLDRFDVLEPAARGPFIDMLAEYAQEHPDTTVLAFGTLKSKPTEQIDGLMFHWIQEGQLVEVV